MSDIIYTQNLENSEGNPGIGMKNDPNHSPSDAVLDEISQNPVEELYKHIELLLENAISSKLTTSYSEHKVALEETLFIDVVGAATNAGFGQLLADLLATNAVSKLYNAELRTEK
jgi:hypothetical protein